MKSIPNKIIDSLSYSLPIISTLKGEVRNLLKKDECGIYIENNYFNWEKAFENIMLSDKYHKNLKNNCEKIFLEKFEFNKNYNRFIINSEKLVNSNSL